MGILMFKLFFHCDTCEHQGQDWTCAGDIKLENILKHPGLTYQPLAQVRGKYIVEMACGHFLN